MLVSDLIRLQTTSWNMVADEYGFDAPAADLIQIAGTLNPDESVRAVFGWTDNDSQGIEIAQSYRRCLRDLTESLEYSKGSHTKISQSSGDDGLQSSNDDDAKSGDGVVGSHEILDIRLHGWSTAAERHNFEQPSIEEVQLAQYSTPGDAIINIMRWTTDDKLVDDIVASYQDACRLKSVAYTQTISEALPDDSDVLKTAAIIETKPPPETTRSGPSMDDVIKLQHNAWTQAAQKFDLTPPTIDEVYAASFMDPNKDTASVFQWSLDANKLEPVVATFRASLKVLSRQWVETIQKQGNELLSGPSLEAKESLPFFLRKEGAKKWLKSLQDVHMPCVVVSYMSSEILDVILREIGLSEFFPADKRVSSSSSYELDMQQILGGALRAERRPDKCVLFSPTP